MKSTGYSTQMTTEKGRKYLTISKRKTRDQMLAFLLACSRDTDKESFRVNLLKTVLPFLTNQAA